MPPRWIIVDGYSLLYRMSSAMPTNLGEIARHQLQQMLEEVAPSLAERITVVFDGRTRDREPDAERGRVEIIFSPGNLTADSVIERMVCESNKPQEILVITSDIAERKTVEAAGAQSMSCGDFLEWCKNTKQEIGRARQDHAERIPPFTLGDFFPE